MKKQSGITIMTLVITIIIMIIIMSVTINLGMENLNVKNLNNLYVDLKTLKDNVAIYYREYGELPLGKKFTESYAFTTDQNPNDDIDEYYVIDVSKLGDIVLIQNLTWTGNEVYIINKETHTIYYPEGVTIDGETYYKLPGEYSDLTPQTDVYGCLYQVGTNEYHLVFNTTGNIALGYSEDTLICKSNNVTNGTSGTIHQGYRIPINTEAWGMYTPWITKVVIEEKIKPASMALYFWGLMSVTEIEGLSKINTSSVTDMTSLFGRCSSLTTLDLSNFNTKRVTKMNNMFSGCSYLTTIYVGYKWNTESVTNGDDMFYGCGNLEGAIKYDSTVIDVTRANTKTGYLTLKQ